MEVNKIASDLLELFGPDGKHWTRHSFARDKYGHSVAGDVHHENACKWCMVGGIRKLYPDNTSKAADALQDFMTRELKLFDTVIGYNDNHSWKQVKDVLVRAANAK